MYRRVSTLVVSTSVDVGGLILAAIYIFFDADSLCCVNILPETKMTREIYPRRNTRAKPVAKPSSDAKMTTRGRPRKIAKSSISLELYEVDSNEPLSEKSSTNNQKVKQSAKNTNRTTKTTGNFKN